MITGMGGLAVATMVEDRPVAKNVAHGGTRPGAGRPRTSERDDVTVRLDRAIAAKARYVAEVRGVSLAEYLSEITDGQVGRDFAKASAGHKGVTSEGGN
jgi:hypothetical protein